MAPRCHPEAPDAPSPPRPPSSSSGILSGPLPSPRSCPCCPCAALGPSVRSPSAFRTLGAAAFSGCVLGGRGPGSGARRVLPATAAAAAVSHPHPGSELHAPCTPAHTHTRTHPRAHPGAQPAVQARRHPRTLVPSPYATSRNAGKAHRRLWAAVAAVGAERSGCGGRCGSRRFFSSPQPGRREEG